MHDLINIITTNINQEAVNSVNGRELHKFIESKQHFTDWIKNRIRDYDFEDGTDFIVIDHDSQQPTGVNHIFKEQPLGGRPSKEYYLTLDMAKELSMLERNAMGRVARKYFIKCEKQAMNTRVIVAELLTSRPLWRKIKRYTEMGLTRKEICLLCERSKATIRQHIRRMEGCGILIPPPNLAELQAKAFKLLEV